MEDTVLLVAVRRKKQIKPSRVRPILVEQLVNSLEMKVHNMTTIATRNQVILKKGIDLQLNMIPFVPMNSGHDTIVERNEETKGNI